MHRIDARITCLVLTVCLLAACGDDGSAVQLPSGMDALPKAEGFPGEPSAPDGA